MTGIFEYVLCLSETFSQELKCLKRELRCGGEGQEWAPREEALPMRVGATIAEAWQLCLQKLVLEVARLPRSNLHKLLPPW